MLKELPIEAVRVENELEVQYLRLNPGGESDYVWYGACEDGFYVLSDRQADALEAAFKLLRKEGLQ